MCVCPFVQHCPQGSKGIRQWPKILMCISNDDTQKYPFCILQLVVEMFGLSTLWKNQPTNQKSIKLLKVVENFIKNLEIILQFFYILRKSVYNSTNEIDLRGLGGYVSSNFLLEGYYHRYCKPDIRLRKTFNQDDNIHKWQSIEIFTKN